MDTDTPSRSRADVTVLPKAIKAWRAVRGLSQEGLADAAGVSSGLIALIETGRRQPGLANLARIAAALEIDPQVIAVIHVDLTTLTGEGAA